MLALSCRHGPRLIALIDRCTSPIILSVSAEHGVTGHLVRLSLISPHFLLPASCLSQRGGPDPSGRRTPALPGGQVWPGRVGEDQCLLLLTSLPAARSPTPNLPAADMRNKKGGAGGGSCVPQAHSCEVHFIVSWAECLTRRHNKETRLDSSASLLCSHLVFSLVLVKAQ